MREFKTDAVGSEYAFERRNYKVPILLTDRTMLRSRWERVKLRRLDIPEENPH